MSRLSKALLLLLPGLEPPPPPRINVILGPVFPLLLFLTINLGLKFVESLGGGDTGFDETSSAFLVEFPSTEFDDSSHALEAAPTSTAAGGLATLSNIPETPLVSRSKDSPLTFSQSSSLILNTNIPPNI